MNHWTKFQAFVKDLNASNVRYVFMRGWGHLPAKPDTDVDLVCHYEDFDRYTEVAERHLRGIHFEDRGFAEYCNMLYHPYITWGPAVPELPNGHFRVDSQNAFFFRSPMNDFKGFWTVPHAFNELVFKDREELDINEYKFFTPSDACDVALLILRNVLDKGGNWKPSHMSRVEELARSCNEYALYNALQTACLARPYDIITALNDGDFDTVESIVLNG